MVTRSWEADVRAYTARLLLRKGTMHASKDIGCAPSSCCCLGCTSTTMLATQTGMHAPRVRFSCPDLLCS